MKEASINAKQAGERGISAKSVKKVTEVRLESLLSHYLANYSLIDVSGEIQGLSGMGTDINKSPCSSKMGGTRATYQAKQTFQLALIDS